ncbi:type II toxin-antitoxin system HipA family toxin [Flavobacterium sp. CS20]|jgi:serine/threonine-protein kinase HipA|uniref:type II toxin-antitoxin system HipA family toxin n=1 Tax=Flavobacterium sp. CS20 TaxID=2775246 RepID=UPI001B3A4652|nr:HipA domain-containing protein [Flavobacterium sp. CS20]QTY26077.1 HipA domain-containing protein [Flavobacterium sp. CS20]
MILKDIKYCPGTLAKGHGTYSRKCLKKVFNGKKVNHILAYDSPASNPNSDQLFDDNRKRISISGVQEKFSVLLDKNKLRLTQEGEQGEYILKPIPSVGKKTESMPANEHLTMQIARQAYGIDVAENALIFFRNGSPAYITKRFDLKDDGSKIAQEDFASLAGRTPQTHGEHYKYLGNYFELFQLLKKYVPAYFTEAPKLLKLLMFNYLFSNGDAHFKNFSLVETAFGDFKLSPAYDLLNSKIHIDDNDFALEDGLLPKKIAQGKVSFQFKVLSEKAEINEKVYNDILNTMLNQTHIVERLTFSSFMDKKTQLNYFQSYQTRLKKLKNE